MSDTETALSATLPGRVVERARTVPNETALRHKHRGIWHETSWREYGQQLAACARGLWELGVREGDRVAILSDNRPEWLYADLGVQAIGGRSVGIYQTSPPNDVAYIINHSRARVLVCEDQEQVDKFLQVSDRCPKLERVLVIEPRGTLTYPEPRLSSFEELLSAGKTAHEANPEWLDQQLAGLDPRQASMIVYTSGTTGEPKGALLSSANIVPVLPDLVAALGLGGKRPELLLSYLPLCHVAEKLFTIFLPLGTPAIVHFGESVDTVLQDLREVSPTVFLGVPRIWEKLYASIQMRMKNSSWLKRKLFEHYARVGVELAEARRKGQLTTSQRLHLSAGNLLVYRPLLERLGLRRCRRAISGASPIGTELLTLYQGLGLTIREGFGMTETAGISHLTRAGAERRGSVGQPVGPMQQRIANDGEVLLRGPSVFLGYLDDDTATRAAIDEDGWLHTGDVGIIEDAGHLTITGRKKEIMITTGGKNLSPERIENALKTSPFIKEAIVIGDRRKFVAALIQIEFDNVGHWAQGQGIPYTSFGDLSNKPEVTMLIDAEIRRMNAILAPVEQVKRFELLRAELTQEEGELTATQKVRRVAVCVRYEDAIETMYLEAGE